MKQKGKRQITKKMKEFEKQSEIYNHDLKFIDVESIKNLVDQTQKIEARIKEENNAHTG